MELIKEKMNMYERKGRLVIQTTIDEDIVISDTKPDIVNVIRSNAKMNIDMLRAVKDRADLHGIFSYNILYAADGGNNGISHADGSINIEEQALFQGINEDEHIEAECIIEDLTVSVINSRKIGIRSIITIILTAEKIYEDDITIDIADNNDISTYKNKLNITKLSISKHDKVRIREEVSIASNKQNIGDIIWYNVDLRNADVKLAEDRISIKGELVIFVIYSGEDENSILQYVDSEIPFNTLLECNGITDEMIPDVAFSLGQVSVEKKPDYDGEFRNFEVDAVLNMNINIYSEDSIDILTDAYSPKEEVVITTKKGKYRNMLVKNLTKCKIADKIALPDNNKILQICHNDADVKIEETRINENGITVDGVITVNLFGITKDDVMPLTAIKGVIPFSTVVDVKGINNSCIYDIRTFVMQLNSVMSDSSAVDIKASVAIDLIAFEVISEEYVSDISIEPLDYKSLEKMPGIACYIVKNGDTLWKIAKKYYTTVDSIKNINGLKEDDINEGTKLLIVKDLT